MHRSVATVSMSGSLAEKLQAIAGAGFDGIELFEPDFIHFNGSAAALRRMVEDAGLSIDLYQPFRDFEGMPPALHARNLVRAERKFDLMQELGVPLVLCCSNVSPAVIDDPSLAAAQLHELAEAAGRRGLRVGFEALAWGRATRLYRQAWNIVQQADHPALGLILDSFHTLSLKDDPAGIVDIPGDRIFFVQMADAPLLGMDVIEWARHHRLFPGQGQFDTTGFFECVLRAGYSGVLSLEIFNDVFRESPNKRTAVDAMRSLLFLESEVRERLRAAPASDARAAAALQRVELFDPPPAPRVAGWSFLEFAVDDAAGRALGALLEQMGFACTARHASRAVSVYRQGEIRLLLNAEPDSFARERFELNGASVCALGLLADDPAGAAARATAMCSRPWADGAAATGEQDAPAIVSPGGNLVYFSEAATGADASLQRGFTPQPGRPAALLQAIDHIALGLLPDQVDTWMLFARASLGFEPGASLQVADPFGLITSRSVASAERKVRFVLNASPSQRTRTAQTVRTTGGGAVHHIAFSTGDIFAAVKQLRANGVAFVPVSPNYYDDLPTRVDIAPDVLAQAREAGVLFDRAGGGDYLHIYTESFDARFFFEIVQRIGGYDDYGVSNAAARMAAQVQN